MTPFGCSVGRAGGWGAAEVSVFEPVGIALDVDDFGVVDEAVDHGGGDGVVSPATFCSYSFPPEAAEDFEIVTDGKTFVAFGEMSDVWALPETWAWPEEIWPADVARVLGGTVTTVAETCPTT